MRIRILSALECTKILTAHRVGRVACARNGQPYIVPFYYAHADNHLYAFSMPGEKRWMPDLPKPTTLSPGGARQGDIAGSGFLDRTKQPVY